MKSNSEPFEYRLQEGDITLPPGCTDQSMQVFRFPGEGRRRDASLVLTRDHETPIQQPKEYAHQQQRALRAQFPGYRLINEGDASLDGQPAAVVDFEWVNNGVRLHQRQAYLRHERAILTFTLTALANDFPDHEAAWNQVISSFRTRRPDVPAPADDSKSPRA